MCLSDFNCLHSSPQVAETSQRIVFLMDSLSGNLQGLCRGFCFTMIQKETYKFDKSHKAVENNREGAIEGETEGSDLESFGTAGRRRSDAAL